MLSTDACTVLMKTTMVVAPASPSASKAAADARPTMAENALVQRSNIVFLCTLTFILGHIMSFTANPLSLRKNIRVDDDLMLVTTDLNSSDDRIETYDETEALESEKHILEMMETENKQLQQQVIEKQEEIDTITKKYNPKNKAQNTLFTELAESSAGVKNEVIHLIVNKYIASTSSDELYDKLDSAFEVIDFKLTDGEPVQVEEYPFLYVGSVGASVNYKSLMAQNITHVINWSPSAKCDVWQEIEYHCIDGIHGKNMAKPRNVKILSDAVEFVEEARLAGGSVLSHCWYGRNRSVTLLVAYLMKYANMSIDEATSQVAKTRPQADPYIDALKLYEKKYLNRTIDERNTKNVGKTRRRGVL